MMPAPAKGDTEATGALIEKARRQGRRVGLSGRTAMDSMLLSGDCQSQPRQLAVCVQLNQSAFSNQRAVRRNHRERAAGLLNSTARFLRFTTPQDVRRNPCTERSD
jgi:hypothetical protein